MVSQNQRRVERENNWGLLHIVAQGNWGRSDQLHLQDSEIDARPYQEAMSVIDKNMEEG